MPEVAPGHPLRPLERLPHDGVEALALPRRGRRELRRERVPGHGRRIQPRLGGDPLDDARDAPVAEGVRVDAPVPVVGTKERSGCDAGGLEPGLQRPDRAYGLAGGP